MLNSVNKVPLWLLLLFSSILGAYSPKSQFSELPEKPLAVVITSYNNKAWVRRNLESVFIQDYSNYRVIYVDDASFDGTADEVELLVRFYGKESQFTLIRNTERVGGMCNLYRVTHSCADHEIIANLDGDDWLPHNQVLKRINIAYSTQNVWLTYGTLVMYPKGGYKWSIPIPQEIIERNAFRECRCPSHFKTFYAWLFKKIDEEDLKYQGEFAPMAWDQAFMFPMIEMAGERHLCIPEITYVYNFLNPISENRINAQRQRDIEAYFRAKRPYARLEESPLK